MVKKLPIFTENESLLPRPEMLAIRTYPDQEEWRLL
jgi:hypothetical protein